LFTTDDSNTIKIFKNPFIIESSVNYKEKIEADGPTIAMDEPLACTHAAETAIVSV
jgi:hypothetical protein